MSNPEDFIGIEVARNEPEAELLVGLLRDAGIDALSKLTNQGAGAGDGFGFGGAHQILVRQRDVEAAREILLQDLA